ncbi:hypothetical protein AWC38_SpisGene15759 [Stylophora pistillata]|uniref:Uncharacterized protein n=1 Tax=Stylophora pistillata TaxID=50429 RepID=A0A2B4RUA4_STYPI|nr:hypothetical protein AWC38_SpisGene15759 [Stylophora pistillata]
MMYSRSSHVSEMFNTLGWDSLEHRRLLNQMCMFYKIYKGFVGISLPAEISPITRASRLPNCTPFVQLRTLNYTFKFSFYPRTVRGSCCSAPLPENTASVSMNLENSGYSYAKAVKQMSQTRGSFKPPSIKGTDSKQSGQDLTSINTKTLSPYSKTTVKKPSLSPDATTTKQTSSVTQPNPATCTKPSAVQQPSSTLTTSQTSTDKPTCTTTKRPSSKQAIATCTNPNFDQIDVREIKAFIFLQGVQVTSYYKPEFIQLAKAVAFMDLPTNPDFENESLEECLLRCLTLPAGEKILDPYQMALLSNDFFQLPPFGLMDIFNDLILSKTDYDKIVLSSWHSFEEHNLCANGHVQSLGVNAINGTLMAVFFSVCSWSYSNS